MCDEWLCGRCEIGSIKIPHFSSGVWRLSKHHLISTLLPCTVRGEQPQTNIKLQAYWTLIDLWRRLWWGVFTVLGSQAWCSCGVSLEWFAMSYILKVISFFSVLKICQIDMVSPTGWFLQTLLSILLFVWQWITFVFFTFWMYHMCLFEWNLPKPEVPPII